MRLSHSLRIDRPPHEVFDAFLDVERVAGCLPGARIAGRTADDAYDGEISVKVGPVTAAYSGRLRVLDSDRDQLRLAMRARGRDRHGAGDADAHVVARLSPRDGGTLVEIDTDLTVRGRVAQFGQGVISQVSDGFLRTFATNLEDMLGRAGMGATAASPEAAADEPAAGGSELDVWALAVRPRLRRYGRPLAAAALCGFAAYLGARLGSRHALRHIHAQGQE